MQSAQTTRLMTSFRKQTQVCRRHRADLTPQSTRADCTEPISDTSLPRQTAQARCGRSDCPRQTAPSRNHATSSRCRLHAAPSVQKPVWCSLPSFSRFQNPLAAGCITPDFSQLFRFPAVPAQPATRPSPWSLSDRSEVASCGWRPAILIAVHLTVWLFASVIRRRSASGVRSPWS